MPTKIKKLIPPKMVEERAKLGELKPGDVFRFISCTYEDAMSGKDDECFYLVFEQQPKKAGRVAVVSVDGKISKEFDDNHIVIPHPAELQIGPAKLVEP
ncbi:MAG TPA: hypothetical protein VF803_00890 [Candidatus Paceibacterota bacterium]